METPSKETLIKEYRKLLNKRDGMIWKVQSNPLEITRLNFEIQELNKILEKLETLIKQKENE